MRWAGDERRLAEASAAVLAYMRRHSIATTWGRSDLASSLKKPCFATYLNDPQNQYIAAADSKNLGK
jgi:hypothetical protein